MTKAIVYLSMTTVCCLIFYSVECISWIMRGHDFVMLDLLRTYVLISIILLTTAFLSRK